MTTADPYRFGDWRSIIADMPDIDTKMSVFHEAATDIAHQWIAGRFDKVTAVDELMGCAEVFGLTEACGVDQVQAMMSDAFAEAARTAKAGSNGKDQPGFDQRFKLTAFKNIKLSTTAVYLVKGIVPREGLVVVWGPPKCGKSFWTFDLVMHPALGWHYRGHKVQQGAVVYLALEGGHGFRARIEAWRRRHLKNDNGEVPFYLITVPVDFIADRDKLVAAIRAQLGEQIPISVVIDTLNRALIGDENKPDDMAKFIRAADTVRTAFECVVVIVHHCGIQGSRPRGHTSLTGAVDAQIAVERDDDGNIVAKIEHMKDGEAGAVIVSRLEQVELGSDDDGDPITSCIIVPVEGAAAVKGPKLKGATQIAFNLLQQLITSAGQEPPADSPIPRYAKVVSAVEWRERFYDAYPQDKTDTTAKAYVRAVLKLQELHLIELWSTFAWLPDKTDKRDF